MGFCTNCGSPVEAEFCGNCGMKVGSAAAAGGPPSFSTPGAPPSHSVPPPVNIGAPKKRGPLFWILAGCGTLVVIAGIVIAVGGFWAFRAAKQAGLDPELLQKNPAMAVAKMMVAANPDLEFVSVDDARGIITVRDKKTGKKLTVNLAEAQKGKFVFEDETGQKVEMQAQGEGDKASIDIKSAEGRMTLGANTQLPEWLPNYPGAEGAGTFGITSKEGSAATYTFKTNDTVEDVVSFYEDALKNEGLEVQKQATQLPGQGAGAVLGAKDSSSQRTATITVTRQGDATAVFMVFESKK